MSLNVYLVGPEREEECECDCGNKHTKTVRPCLFSANITHNLSQMADKAGIYEALWRPNENGFKYANQLIEPLECGISAMKSRREYFEQFNAENGWGLYENFLPWLEAYLEACKAYPDALVEVSR